MDRQNIYEGLTGMLPSSKQYCATRTGGMSSSNNKTTDTSFFLPFLNVRPCSVLQVNIKLYLAPKQKHRCMLIPGIPPKKNSFCWCPFAVAIRTEKRYVYGVTRCVQMRPATTIIIYKIPSKQPTPLRKAITLMTDPSTGSSDSECLASGRSPSRCWNQIGPCAEADVGPESHRWSPDCRIFPYHERPFSRRQTDCGLSSHLGI